MSKSKHICPVCGGTEFFTVATVLQEWRVNADGDFKAISADRVATFYEPDDGNVWNCTACGSEGVLVDMTLCVTAMQQCAGFMAKSIGRHYNSHSLDVDAVFKDTDDTFGKNLRNAVLAATILNNSGDGRIDPRNASWAAKVRLPDGIARRDMISADLTCRGSHIGLADMLASKARKEAQND